MNTRILSIAVGIIVVLGGIATFFLSQCEDDWCYLFQWQKIKAADSFERCASLGFPVMESYPRQCRAGDKSFTEEIKSPEHDKIYVMSPLPNALIQSPFIVEGEARGTWYFEASFPVKLIDSNGKVLAYVPAQAQGEWMTTEFVPFLVSIPFDAPTVETGTLILEKDNPSGLPEHDDSVSIPIRFNVTPAVKNFGTLQGTMTLGPICPVERIDQPCKPTPEMFAARKVFIYASDKKTLVTTLTPNGEGKFTATLKAGEYWVDMAHQGVGGASGVPATIHISENKTTTLTIDVDTGIR